MVSMGLGLSFSSRGVTATIPFAQSSDFALDAIGDRYRVGSEWGTDLLALTGASYTRAGTISEVNSSNGVETFAADELPNATGRGIFLREAVTNLLLNAGGSGSLSTQSVTLPASQHTLSFIGTGTVTLTGASTAGPLVGTGASDRVELAFTPSAGSVTFTVSGTVQYAMLQTGGIATAIVPTAGSSATAALSDLEVTLPSALSDEDMLIWAKCSTSDVDRGDLLEITDGTSADRVSLFITDNHQARCQVRVSNSIVYQANSTTLSDGVDLTIILRRESSNWRLGTIVDGTLSWITSDTAGSMPAGLVNAFVGQDRNNSNCLNRALEAAAITPGTFSTDQEVTDAIAEITG